MDDGVPWISYRRLAWVVGFVAATALTVLFGVASKGQVPYLVNGCEAEATVTRMTSRDLNSVLSRFGGPADVWWTEYTFAEPDGTARTGAGEVPVGTGLKPGQTIRVRYTSGPDGRSAIVRPYEQFAPWGFGLSAGAAVVALAFAVLPFVRRLHAASGRESQQGSFKT